MRRRVRRLGVTPLGWWLLVAAWLVAAAAIPLLGAVLSARAEEVDPPRYEPADRGPRPAVLERAEVVDLAAEVFGPDVAEHVADIVRCESTYRPAVDTNWPYVGLMQIHPGLHRHRLERIVGRPLTLAETRLYLTDPLLNLLVAADVLRDQGFGAWPVCRWAR